ncbi:winged helix-turn-helix transcriptional regulator [Clostridium frigidicarnis]|uniref:DNA-binding transcriptional regulator, HxlR family n=1 Tax=Clostridium frigidicarnis TaxID=84698 RepID=A0A1I0Y9J9_9CLOT|nr:helix-turn-helix domain-containing protein [Clostridium frigidicarnis]SFB09924.1 DNA-binding transcriptional regulator, HxlR family [Clostridium frigidicarnis]
MKIRDEYTCPLEVVHDIIKGKWKSIILWQLKYGPTSLSKLEHDISGISQKMLLEQLKELKEFGLVDKVNFNGYPLHVEYFLTEERGKKIIPALEILQSIGVDYMVEHGMTAFLEEKGIVYSTDYPQKSK